MDKLRTIIVPTNKTAMEDLNYGIEYDKVKRDDYLIWHLSEKEFSLLWDSEIFDCINRNCKTLIDDSEDECIEYEKLLIVKEIIMQYKKPLRRTLFRRHQQPSIELEKLSELVDKAILYETCVDFAF